MSKISLWVKVLLSFLAHLYAANFKLRVFALVCAFCFLLSQHTCYYSFELPLLHNNLDPRRCRLSITGDNNKGFLFQCRPELPKNTADYFRNLPEYYGNWPSQLWAGIIGGRFYRGGQNADTTGVVNVMRGRDSI